MANGDSNPFANAFSEAVDTAESVGLDVPDELTRVLEENDDQQNQQTEQGESETQSQTDESSRPSPNLSENPFSPRPVLDDGSDSTQSTPDQSDVPPYARDRTDTSDSTSTNEPSQNDTQDDTEQTEPTQPVDQNAQPPTGGPPGGSETIQSGQPRDSGSDRVSESEPTQPVDQQQSEQTGTGDGSFVRQPGGGIPSGSETIQGGQPKPPDDVQTDAPPEKEFAGGYTRSELEKYTIPEAGPDAPLGAQYPELYPYGGSTTGGTPLPTTHVVTDGKDYAFNPSDPQDVARWLAGKEQRKKAKKRISEGREARRNLQNGNISPPNAFTDQSALQREVNIEADSKSEFRQKLRSEFADRYSQATVSSLVFGNSDITISKTDDGGLRPQLSESAKEKVREFRREGVEKRLQDEVADLFNWQYEDTQISEDDVKLERQDGQVQFDVSNEAQARVRENQREWLRRETAEQLRNRTGVDSITGEDVNLERFGTGAVVPLLTEGGRQEVRTGKREQRIEQAVEEFQQADTPGSDSITRKDIRVEDGVPQLKDDVRRQLAAERTGLNPDDFAVRADGELQIDPALKQQPNERAREQFTQLFQQRKQARTQVASAVTERVNESLGSNISLNEDDIDLTRQGPQLTTEARNTIETQIQQKREEARQQSIQQGIEDLEQNLSTALPGERTFSTFGTQKAPEVQGPGFDLDRDDVQLTENNQLTLTESAAKRFEETQRQAARQQIDQQLPTNVGAEDVTVQDGTFTLSEQGREELREFQRQQAQEQLLAKLREETGADLETDDIKITTETNDEGKTVFSAKLTKSGEREFAGEQVPGSDLPWIGGTLERGGEEAAGIEQTFRGVGDWIERQVPTPEIPTIDLPDISSKEVASAAAVGVAAPEPVTSGTGALVLGGIAAGGATVAAADKVGLGKGAPQAGATTFFERSEIGIPEDGNVRGTTEIQIPEQVGSVSEFLPQEGTTATGQAIRDREIPVSDQTGTEAEIQLPQSVFGEQVDPTRLVTGQLVGGQLIGDRTGEETDVEDDELGVPDDPWLESDRRLYDPTRTFGEQEDITTPVDPTTDESPSREDIAGGIGGVGNPEPAREGAETFEENFRQYLKEQREEAERQEVFERQELLNTDDGEEESLLDELLGAQEAELDVTEPQALADETSLLPQSDSDPLAGVFGPDRERTQAYTGELTRARGAVDEATDGRARQTQPEQIPQSSQADLTEELVEEQLPTQQQIAEEQQVAAEQQAASLTGSGYSYGFGQPTEYEYPTVEPVVDRPSYRTPPWPDLPDLDSGDSDDEFPIFAGSAERYEFDFLDPLSGDSESTPFASENNQDT